MNNEPIINCQGLEKVYVDGQLRVAVLRNVNLTINRGELVAIVGASGSGKSTLLHLLGGLDQPTSGSVSVAGRELTKLSDAERSHLRNECLGFVYQFHHLLPEFTVLENTCMPLLIRGMDPEQASEKARKLLIKVGLESRLDHKLGELSGGERQRTAIVRALVTDPLCVLADEPTGNLDRHTAEKVYQSLLELNQALGTSLVIVTHDTNLAKRMNRVLTIQEGTLIPADITTL